MYHAEESQGERKEDSDKPPYVRYRWAPGPDAAVAMAVHARGRHQGGNLVDQVERGQHQGAGPVRARRGDGVDPIFGVVLV